MRNHRPVKFTVRLSHEESLELAKRSACHGVDQAEFIRRKIFGGSMPVPPQLAPVSQESYKELTRLKTELTKWGNNLNQITRSINSGQCPASVGKEITNIRCALDEMRSKLDALHKNTIYK